MSAKKKFSREKNKLIISLTDSYKLGRHLEYPKGTRRVNEVLVARDSNFDDSDMKEFVVFGSNYAISKIKELFRDNFFDLDYDSVEEEMKLFVKDLLPNGDKYDFSHWKELYEYGSLPLSFKGVPEGSVIPIGTPYLEIINTDERFFWLPNFIETIFLSYIWPCTVSATRAFKIANIALKNSVIQFKNRDKVIDYIDNVMPFQFHDFSMRGQMGLDACEQTGMGHLCVFNGTDNLSSIQALRKCYSGEDGLGSSIPAVEHSSTTSNICAYGGGLEAEEKYIKRLLGEIYPNTPVSYVCDSYDFWGVVSKVIPRLKDFILSLSSKLVIRPDSGDPVKILCGNNGISKNWVNSEKKAERRGLIKCIADLFGTKKDGIIYLSDNIGIVYGDGMNYDRISKILCFLVKNKIYTGSVVFGLGAVQQSLYTRDNLGIALKTTYIEVSGNSINVSKDPKTSSRIKKKSPKGRVCVGYDKNGNIKWNDSTGMCDHDMSLWGNIPLLSIYEIRDKIYTRIKKNVDILLN